MKGTTCFGLICLNKKILLIYYRHFRDIENKTENFKSCIFKDQNFTKETNVFKLRQIATKSSVGKKHSVQFPHGKTIA